MKKGNTQQGSLFSQDERSHSRPPLPGYRLDKLEVYNWGTFDGTVHSVQPRGESVLLVGENGAGKSTLVDAVLTLLVRPGIRNYNVAAGAGKKERDETSYIRGAYDKTAGEDERSRTQYLRHDTNFYSALLASFRCASSGRVFTLAQVMHVGTDKRTIWYAYDEKERGISEDISGFASIKDIKSTMEKAGWEVTDSYKTYHHWLKRKVRFQPKAMDVFNQTVAVKDVHKLDDFIRTHMLEKKPWNDKVDKLLGHFTQLSEAYKKLIEVRQQAQLLEPIIQTGDRYEALDLELETLCRQQQTLPAYFDDATVRLLEPLCTEWSRKLADLTSEIESLDELITARHSTIAKLGVEINQQGGDRIRDLRNEMQHHLSEASSKKRHREQIEALLTGAGIEARLTSVSRFDSARAAAKSRIEQLEIQSKTAEAKKLEHDLLLAETQRQLSHETNELESLRKRRNNLPTHFIDVRDAICASLGVSADDLPFAAEMVTVDPANFDWEASIELVLSSFARTLLVPDDLYHDVSHHIDRNRLLDRHGQGMRLSYDRVDVLPEQTGPVTTQQRVTNQQRRCLPDMLQYRPKHSLSPFVRGQIEIRFNLVACETIAEFQKQAGRAMTKNRHIKLDDRRHSKDDRNAPDDRRHFVLGWDNKAKIKALEGSIRDLTNQTNECSIQSDLQRRRMREADEWIKDLHRFCDLPSFESIDDGQHDAEADRCHQELKRLEASNDLLIELKARMKELEAERRGFEQDRQKLADQKAEFSQQLKQGTSVLQNVNRSITAREVQPDTTTLAELNEAWPIDVADFVELQQRKDDASRRWNSLVEQAREKLRPVGAQLSSRMNGFLNRFPAFGADMGVSPADLPAYRVLKTKIDQDELPQHARRFRQRLKTSVLQEIGVLNATLEQERADIRSKIELLNNALRPLDWERNTYIRLEPKDSRDPEIREFQGDLHRCLDHTMDEANEQTFKRIEAFVEKLRDDAKQSWRERVVDVRNWFNFVARVYDKETNAAGAEYDGGSGKSGGEKGKLAFLVLVAAIAYQYDLKPDGDNEDRFHFVMVDEMFSRSDDTRARAALELFERFGLQLAIVAPLDAKARIVEDHVGMYCHIVKDAKTHRSRMLSLTADQYDEVRTKV